MEHGRVGHIGLGQMGLPMAATLAKAGFEVLGHDLSAARLAAAREAGVALADAAAAVFAGCDVVVVSLPRAADVAAVLNAALPDLAERRGRRIVVVDTSTSEPDVSRDLARRLAEAGHGFLDAPVSGGPAGAAAGALTFMVGGDPADLTVARPAMTALAAQIVHVGPSGAGNVVKLVNNMLVAAHMVTTREALALAEAAGVDAETLLGAVNAATGRSALSEIHFPRWVLSGRFDSGFSAGLMRKDLGLALALAARTGTDLPLAEAAAALWRVEAGAPEDLEDFMLMARSGAAPAENVS